MIVYKDMTATAIVAAAATTRGIGTNGSIPWMIPSDLKHFARVTTTITNVPSPSPPKKKINDDEIPSSSSSSPKVYNAVVMGRTTWESIPNKFRPLKNRHNIILTRQADYSLFNSDKTKDDTSTTSTTTEPLQPHISTASSLLDAWHQLSLLGDRLGNIFIIGGQQIYQDAIEQNYVQSIIYTEILNNEESTTTNTKLQSCDVFFPELLESEWMKRPYMTPVVGKKNNTPSNNNENDNNKENADNGTTTTTTTTTLSSKATTPTTTPTYVTENGYKYCIWEYNKININNEEQAYLDLCNDIITNGITKDDRTGVGTKSQFGTQLKFDCRNGQLPLLTTKKTFWKGVVEELIWFLKGSTNADELSEKGVNIWKGNASKEFLKSRGLDHYEEGDLGPVYGFQWRHFGATYQNRYTDYTNQGIDQLQDVINKIKYDPNNRRIIMTAWNPNDLNKMALPPCHMFVQFYVDVEKNEVSCQLYQRSADMGLGVPFNICSYALLLHLIAHVTGRKPGTFIHTMGDCHVYLNHIQPIIEQQLIRQPRTFPKLFINDNKEQPKSIDDFSSNDFIVIGYHPYKPIKMTMAV